MCIELKRHGCLCARTVAKIRHSKLESVHDNLPGGDGPVLCRYTRCTVTQDLWEPVCFITGQQLLSSNYRKKVENLIIPSTHSYLSKYL